MVMVSGIGIVDPPTPHGAILVSWAGRRVAPQVSMSVTAPCGTNGFIAVPAYGAANPIAGVGGKVVWSGGSFTATGRTRPRTRPPGDLPYIDGRSSTRFVEPCGGPGLIRTLVSGGPRVDREVRR
jgi:hypothetical protein